jgi:TonB-linked SusC/RagA family outer membrane protein
MNLVSFLKDPTAGIRRLTLGLLLCLISGVAPAQNTTPISGLVLDEEGYALPGATVVIKGTTTGTQTDLDGNFTLEASPDDILQVSYIGYRLTEVPVSTESVMEITLGTDATTLGEVVVTGYGSQSRNQLTTSVSKLDDRVLETATRSNAATALQGNVAGLRVTNLTGQPGATPSIQLRGGTGFDGAGSPLILVDGVPSSFYGLNSDDIESIEVLKDAAATAIYGARSANGVILVTTKSGRKGRSSITFKQRYAVNQERELPEYIGAADFIRLNRQAVRDYREATGRLTQFGAFLDGATAFGTGNNTTDSPFTTQFLTDDNRYLLEQPGWSTIPDPLDPSRQILFQENDVNQNIYQDSRVVDSYIAADGGNERGTYYLGLGYMDNEGLIHGSAFKRYSGKFTASYRITDRLRVNSNLLYTHSNFNQSPLGDNNTVFRRFAGQAPTARVYNNNPDGTLSNVLNPGTNRGFGNPLYYKDKFVRDNLEQRLNASIGLDWDLIDNVKVSVRGSHFTINNQNSAFDRAFLNGRNLNTERFASASLARTLRNQLTATANYSRTFAAHGLDLLIGGEYYHDNAYSFSAATIGSPTDLIETLNAGSEARGVPTSFETENKIISNFGRLNYDYDDRYLLSLTYRYDGTSQLGNNKYGFFPGVSLGWNLNNEEFFQNIGLSSAINVIKPRISYGVNGNLTSLPGNYGVYGSYGSQGIYDGNTGYANTALPTLDLRWERATTLNFGLDISLFNYRVSLLADYFIRDVEDKIAGLTLPIYTGFSSISTNNGTLRNRGLELELTADVIDSENWNWRLRGTLTHNRNYVVSLPENDNELNRQGGTLVSDPETGEEVWIGGLQEGQRVGTDMVITYVQDYIYADQAAVDEHAERIDELLPNGTVRFPGDVAWVDVNGDDVINAFDRQFIGRTTPDFVGGLSSNLTYRNFSLYVQTDFATGHVIYNHIRGKGLAQTQGNLNQDATVLQAWTPENRNTDIPRFLFVDGQRNIFRGNEATVNSRFWEKGNYLALREVTLSYNFPAATFRDRIKGLTVYLTGSNLHYFKSYSGDTPEIGGYQAGEFPVPRVYQAGFNLTF